MAKNIDFWMKPDDPLTTVKEISFGYTDAKGKKKEYKATPKGDDYNSQYAFHAFIRALMVCKKKSLMPWTMPAIRSNKDKVVITNFNDDGEQMEMALKVADNFRKQSQEEVKYPWDL
jgi:hypothetical protein